MYKSNIEITLTYKYYVNVATHKVTRYRTGYDHKFKLLCKKDLLTNKAIRLIFYYVIHILELAISPHSHSPNA